MKTLFHIGVCIVVIGLALAGTLAVAESDFDSMDLMVDPAWPTLPPGWNFGEVAGIAADSRGHVFVLHRGENPIMEFAPDGRMVRSWGEGMFIRPHAIRVDPEGNIWTVDNDTHQVLKMDSSGRVRMVVGRRGQSGETDENFNRPTDVAFAPNGDFYVSDGYVNSRVRPLLEGGSLPRGVGHQGRRRGRVQPAAQRRRRPRRPCVRWRPRELQAPDLRFRRQLPDPVAACRFAMGARFAPGLHPIHR